MITNKEYTKIVNLILDLLNHGVTLSDVIKELEEMKN